MKTFLSQQQQSLVDCTAAAIATTATTATAAVGAPSTSSSSSLSSSLTASLNIQQEEQQQKQENSEILSNFKAVIDLAGGVATNQKISRMQPTLPQTAGTADMDLTAVQSMDWFFKKEQIYLLAQFWQQVSEKNPKIKYFLLKFYYYFFKLNNFKAEENFCYAL